jgi:hypothetical protein
MRKFLNMFLFLLLASPALLTAQVSVAGLFNDSGGTAYVISLPTNSDEYRALLASPDSLKALVRQYADRITAIPAGGLYRSLPVCRQDTLVFGYSLIPGELVHPLFLLRIPAGSEGSYFEIGGDSLLADGEGAYLGFSAIDEDLPAQGSHQIDGRILDWLQSEDDLRYSRSFSPQRIRRESPSTSTEIGVGDSVYWGRGGTGLDRLRLALDDDFFYGMASSYQEIQDGLSLLLYFYQERSESSLNLYAIEVPIAGDTGHVLLWRGERSVEVVGNYHRGDFFFEFQVNREYLPREIQQSLEGLQDGSFDVSTGFTDGAIYEEFLFGNVPLNNRFDDWIRGVR